MTILPSQVIVPRGQAADCPEVPVCPVSPCSTVFERIVVDFLTAGTTTVSWELRSDFTAPAPLTFTLQVNEDADALTWVDAQTVIDAYQATDGGRRDRTAGHLPRYRIRVVSAAGTVYSPEFTSEAVLRGIVAGTYRVTAMSAIAVAKLSPSYQQGWLFKRRLGGANCLRCLDAAGRPTDSNCPECRGTGKTCGYLSPRSCVWADLKTRATDKGTTPGRGFSAGLRTTTGLIVPSQLVSDEDVWVSAVTDDRYFIKKVAPLSAVAGVPVVSSADFELAGPNSILYDLALPS